MLCAEENHLLWCNHWIHWTQKYSICVMFSLDIMHRNAACIVVRWLNITDFEMQYCVMFSLDAMSLSTIDTEMQYFVISSLHVVHRKTALIYCDEAFQYIGHRNAVFLMPSLDGVLRKTAFVELQPLNTLDTEKQYLCNVFNISWHPMLI